MPLSTVSVAALAVLLSLFLTTTLADDQANFTEGDFATLDISRLAEIVEDARSKFNNIDANHLFFNSPSIGDYFDNITAASGFLNKALEARTTGSLTTEALGKKYLSTNKAVGKIFDGSSSKTDEQAAPLGLRECRLLPERLRNFDIVPLVGVTLNALTAPSDKWSSLPYNYDSVRTTCATSTVGDSLDTLEALMGENCGSGVGRNVSAEEIMQEAMKQYASENHFGGLVDENRCLHVFVARHTKSAEAVAMFTMSLDKYYLAAVTIQAFCAVFAPKSGKEALRARVLATHSSLAKSLAQINISQFDDGPWKCETRPDELIAAARASREDIMSKVQSNTSFLGDLSPEQYVNMIFEMVDALRSVDKTTFEWLQNASTGPRDAEVRKRTRVGVIDLTVDLLNKLEWIHDDIPMPFGFKRDVLWPQYGFEYRWLSEAAHGMLKDLGREFTSARNAVNVGKNDETDGSQVQYFCEDFELRRAANRVKGGYESQVEQDPDDDETWAAELMKYAMEHGFGGCEDNKCLPFFIARYAYHRSEDVDKLKISVDKYARILVFIQSVCASFPFEDSNRKEDMRLNAVEVVRSLKEIMDQLSNLSSRTDHYTACDADRPRWASEVEACVKYGLEHATSRVNTSSWEDRQRLHELVANGTVEWLDRYEYKDGYNFTVVAYLPFADDGLHGFVHIPIGAEDVLRNEAKSVKYVVSRFPKRAVQSLTFIRARWEAIEKNGNQILDATFSTRASNLSKRIEEVEDRFKKDIDGAFLSVGGFRALVALRCGYEFVWYELGYRYFPAGFATGGYVLATQQDNKYKYNCGQIVFFP